MAVASAGRVGHEERVSVVEHLDELRSRLIVALAALAAAFGICMWQSHALLRLADRPLAEQTRSQARAGSGPLGAALTAAQGNRSVAEGLDRVVAALRGAGSGVSPQVRSELAGVQSLLGAQLRRPAASPEGERPVTLGVGEPFTTSVGVAFMFALVFALPVLLYELYAFAIPAFAPERRRNIRSLLLAVPVLFVVGVVFGYLVVLPGAIRFLQGFNSEQFDVLVQASQYYSFAATILAAMGLVFQVPVAMLAVTRAGIVTTEQLARNRRYAVLACAGVAALLPGDPVTMLLETVPLYLLFELSLLLARLWERRAPAV